jgi:hypothetical protein
MLKTNDLAKLENIIFCSHHLKVNQVMYFMFVERYSHGHKGVSDIMNVFVSVAIK